MPVFLADMGLDAGDALGQPARVGDGDHEVLRALPEKCGHPDLVELEAPRLREREVVIPPTCDALAERLLETPLHVDGALAGQDGGVDRREDGLPDLLDLPGR